MNNLQTVLHTKEARTTSINVAWMFGKNHKAVMRDIRNLIQKEQKADEINRCESAPIKKPDASKSGYKQSAELGRPKVRPSSKAADLSFLYPQDEPKPFVSKKFFLVDYVDNRGRTQPMYEMNRDGFLMLALGFTGDEAYRLKEIIINRFNNMESAIRVANQLGTDRMLYLTKGDDFVLREGEFIDPNDLMVLR